MDLPAANGPEIHMDKLRLRVVADTAAMQGERRVAQTSGGNTRHANVDGFAEHVLAMLGDAHTCAAKKFVAPRRAIAANNVDFSAGMANSRRQIAEQIKQARIKINDVTGAVIAEEMIEAIDRVGKIGIALAIDDIDALIRVQMKEQQAMFRQWKTSSGGHTHREDQEANQEKRKLKKTAWKHLVILARGYPWNS